MGVVPGGLTGVSTRARQVRRATICPPFASRYDRGFQSAPANKGGRNQRALPIPPLQRVGFNPRPPIKAGEPVEYAIRTVAPDKCFEPAPANKGGQTTRRAI